MDGLKQVTKRRQRSFFATNCFAVYLVNPFFRPTLLDHYLLSVHDQRTESWCLMGKVTDRREQMIEAAAVNKDWDTVERLLDQELNNAERRDRYHHKRSLEFNISKNGRRTELHDVVKDKAKNPEEALIKNELDIAIEDAKKQLSPIDRQIFELKVEEDKSYSAIARIVGRSDKTVKSHYFKAISTLRFLLTDYQ